jgi:hypothetical protein
MSQDIQDLIEKIEEYLDEEGIDYDPRSYSGRRMYGKESSFAFTSDVHPNSEEGHQLQALGLRVDNMGRDYIYYLTR